MGARTIKMGRTRWYVGYKKHTLRLWLHEYQDSVQLVPLISWVTGANVYDGRMLLPSLRHCQRIWEWCPAIVVGDGAYLSREAKRESRLRWNVAVLTRLRSDMGLVAPYVTEHRTECPQGELIEWRGFDPRTQRHWYGTRPESELCSRCWEASRCPREFSYGAEEHEGLLGVLPSGSNYARLLLERTRPWVEPAQSYEKNQLGLNDAFYNSLRMTWTMSLLADAVVGMRARALTEAKPVIDLLAGLRGQQMLLGLPDENEGLGER